MKKYGMLLFAMLGLSTFCFATDQEEPKEEPKEIATGCESCGQGHADQADKAS